MNNSKHRLITLLLSLFLLALQNAFSQTDSTAQKDNVVAQMNYCLTSLTNIIHNKSMSVLEHESDQILNNLTIEHIIGLYEINDFRIELLDAVSKFGITEQERALLRRIQSIKRDNMKWTALSNALNPTMLLTGGGKIGPQLAFQALLTAARSAVEYQTMKGEQNIEELKAMWDLRKEDLKEINEVRINALKVVFSLYNKYQLSEKDRLTEATANNFSLYISEPNAAKRARLLEDNRDTYEHLADYYYHLGMAYLDLGNYDKAKSNLNNYLIKYGQTPLLRYDEKSGCVALAILANENNLSDSEKKYHIQNALKNLPHNSPAILQCAMIYLCELGDEKKALELIRAGIEDPKASDQSLLYMTAANLLPIAKKYPELYSELCSLFNYDGKIMLESYITYLMNTSEDVWNEISSLVKFENYSSWLGKSFNEEFNIVLPSDILYDNGDISVYVEEHSPNKVVIKQLQPNFEYGVDISDIEDVDCFKNNKELKYLYFDVLVPGQIFIVKQNIDYNKIQNEQWHRQSEFVLSQDDIDDIIDFCKDNTPDNYDTTLKLKAWKGDWIEESVDSINVQFCGDDLKYRIHHSHKQSGYYVRIVLSNGIHLMYKYEKESLVPYMYIFNDKMYFATEEYKNEFEYQGIKTTSWYEDIWNKVTNIISESKNKLTDITQKGMEKPSLWTKKAKTAVKNWFSDEKEEN